MTWEQKSLDELGFVGRGKSKHRPRDAAHLYGGPYPFIQTGDVKHANFYITEYSQTYSEAGLAQSKLWKSGTLCITIAANIAETAILGIDACFPDSIIGFIPDDDKADVRYVKYLFDTLKKRYQQFSQGAAQDNLSRKKLLSLKFPVPPLPFKKDIASTLSSYDNLIENNRRRIALLEEAARLLYREWFVYLRFPGHEHTPIVDGVPQGWQRVRFPEVVDFKEGPGLRNWQYRDNGVPFLNIRVIGNNEVNFSKIQYLDEFEVYERYQHFLLREDDHVVSSSGTLGRVITIRKVHLPLCLNTSLIRMRPIGKRIGKWQLKHFVKSRYFLHQMDAVATGAAQRNFGPSHLKKLRMIVPSETIGIQYERITASIEEQIKCLLDQNLKLSNARDLLLPRLMNGEIAA